jgi:aldehyde dehydrogenase (NAD+)
MSPTPDVATDDDPSDSSPSRPAIEVLDPAHLDDVVGHVPAMTPSDVAAAYRDAAKAVADWRARGPLGRSAVLARAAALLRDESEALTRLLVRENGKLWAEASVEVAKTADFLDYYAGFGRQPTGVTLADGRPHTLTSVRHEPLGVVLLITPWNDPLLTPARKIAPALFCGNTLLLKPAPDTPLIALALADVLVRAGLPDDVLTVVTGHTDEIGDALIEAPELAALSFTGSTAVGHQLRARLASRTVRVQTEMGGKNAAVVFAGADLDDVVQVLVQAGFAQAGQRCTATSRVVVADDRADELVERLASAVEQLVPGPGLEPDSSVGALINRPHRDRVHDFVTQATREGARVVTGGSVVASGDRQDGCFYAPTVVDHVQPEHTVWREEVFGPVVAVHRVTATTGEEFFEQALALVNDSVYGLAASAFTPDLGEALRFADGVQTGQVSVNLPTSGWDVHHPFGGFGESGSAFKEQGAEALHFYSRTKTVAIGHGGGR